jgi:ketosteroid isomerase-like protein
MDTPDLETALARYCRFFETLEATSLKQIDDLFAADALFSDPFNRVRGPAAIRRIFEHLLRHWPKARFQVLEACGEEQQAYLRWTFRPDPSRPLSIEGVSRVRFNADGRVVSHRDYWDSASELYARLPVLGAPVRWLLRRSQAEPADQIPGAES